MSRSPNRRPWPCDADRTVIQGRDSGSPSLCALPFIRALPRPLKSSHMNCLIAAREGSSERIEAVAGHNGGRRPQADPRRVVVDCRRRGPAPDPRRKCTRPREALQGRTASRPRRALTAHTLCMFMLEVMAAKREAAADPRPAKRGGGGHGPGHSVPVAGVSMKAQFSDVAMSIDGPTRSEINDFTGKSRSIRLPDGRLLFEVTDRPLQGEDNEPRKVLAQALSGGGRRGPALSAGKRRREP